MSGQCGAKTTKNTPCQHPAGWGTGHRGVGRCILHGESTVPYDSLLDELTVLRGLLWQHIGKSEQNGMSEDDRDATFAMVEKLGRTIERIIKIKSQHAATASEINKVARSFGDLMGTYIEDVEQRRAYIDALQRSVDAALSDPGSRRGDTLAIPRPTRGKIASRRCSRRTSVNASVIHTSRCGNGRED